MHFVTGWWDAQILEVCEEGEAFTVGISGTHVVQQRVKATWLRPRWFYSNAARLFVCLLDGRVWCAPARATSLQPMQSPVRVYAPTDDMVKAIHQVYALQEELQNTANKVQAATDAVGSAREGCQVASDALEAAKRSEEVTSEEVKAVEMEMNAINYPEKTSTEIKSNQDVAMQMNDALAKIIALHSRKSHAKSNKKKAKEAVRDAATSLQQKQELLSQAEDEATALESKHHEIGTKLTNLQSWKAQAEAIRLKWPQAGE